MLAEARAEAELEQLRAVEELHRKYDDREERFLQQLQELQERFLMLQNRTCAVSITPPGEADSDGAKTTTDSISGEVDTPTTGEVSNVGTPVQACSGKGNSVVASTPTIQKDTQPKGNVDALSDLPTALLAQQFPPPQLPNFNGGDASSEDSFQDWIGQFELVAEIYRWNKQAKFMHLITRLRGEAFQFYRSCSKHQKSDYDLLVAELKHRFTPVRIQSVQTSLLHERKQGQNESVDSYAQSLKSLFRKAYPQVQQGGESIGKSVLVSQFVAGLLPALKMKVAGVDGKFDEILVKARFEEVKLRELGTASTSTPKPEKQLTTAVAPGQPSDASSQPSAPAKVSQPSTRPFKCSKCGGTNHIAKYCRWRGRSEPGEARGASQSAAQASQNRVGAITEKPDEPKQPENCTREAEINKVLDNAMTTMHTVTTSQSDAHLGPTLTAKVKLEGVPINALVDTGSPTTIVSLKFLIDALAKQKKSDESPAQWRKRVEQRLEPPGPRLKSYGGEKLNTVCQIKVAISHGEHSAECVVQVQKGAPADLLLGTDVHSRLGILVLACDSDNSATDLLSNQCWSKKTEPDNVVEEPTITNVEPQEGTVKLITATRLPARQARLVRARVEGADDVSVTLLQPASQLRERGLVIEEATLAPDAEHIVSIPIQNFSCEPLFLKPGEVLGQVQPVTLDDNLTPQEVKQLNDLILEFSDIFALDQSELSLTDVVTHAIDTGDSAPIKQHPRRIPFALRNKVDHLVSEMLDQGIVVPSKNPWASPVVLVAKKDGSTRFCVDYRRLNSVTKTDVFPLPRVDDSLDQLSNLHYFTTLDLAAGYWQVLVEPKSREKTAFVTHSGLFEFSVMPFGLKNTPATFQRLMETILSGLIRNVCLDYLDDIIVTGWTFAEHLANLCRVFLRLREDHLKLKPLKCFLAMKEVEYLGFRVSGDGIIADPVKVNAVQNFPNPVDVKQVRSFLGLASYYRRFIPNFFIIAKPLYALTKKDAVFLWSDSCAEAFARLKTLLTQVPILAFPDFSSSFRLETDASGLGLGAVLSQEQEDGTIWPIAYASRTLQPHECNYRSTELEALGVV